MKVNRLKISVQTTEGIYEFDEHFDKKVNFIASYENTKGKSSCVESIYYCLGVEELIGGTCEKALKPVFRKVLLNESDTLKVIDTYFLLEIQNQKSEVITIFRTANNENFSSKLVRIYYSSMNNMSHETTKYEDMYVHSKGAATNSRGFHKFLEDFINWNLPEVPAYDNEKRKLYIQTIFSAMFIEQKRGWSDFLTTLPTYFKIKEPKKRVIEFLLNLETLESEKLREKYKQLERGIKSEWSFKVNRISKNFEEIGFFVEGISSLPETQDDLLESNIKIFRFQDRTRIGVNTYKEILIKEINKLSEKKVFVKENFEDLQNEFTSMNNFIIKNEVIFKDLQEQSIFLKESIKKLTKNLEIINKDILNNKDVLKLKSLGSTSEWSVNKDICPTCHQKIEDSLLLPNIGDNFMSLEENILHLESQKNMLEFAIESHKEDLATLSKSIKLLELKLQTQRKILRSITNDLYSNENNYSETIIRKRILIENELEEINKKYELYKQELMELKSLSIKWKELIINKKALPGEGLTKKDKAILSTLRENFVANLKEFGYSSIDTSSIQISENKLLPIIEGFDMKFDSSASDNIRGIWAYTLAVMQTSGVFNGNHTNFLIFDEPDQQSIVLNDMNNFLMKLQNIEVNCQMIIGITIKDDDTKELIQKLDKEKCKVILLNERAIKEKKIENEDTI
ncbi:hypothetical protein [Bacillus cereus]|uniref:hypothetical protein n=1 Tax=Bacillus cereus TaxID=1396 RepID=UPI000BFBC1B4|nr:hypothetical protein [Bacillus cereus]PGY12023.1 hypothetical protein COE23_18745 [Bacillus cereus]